MNIDKIRRTSIELLDCQVDLLLKSLEFYMYTYQYVYPRRRKSESKEENSRICLVRDTYEQILSQFGLSKKDDLNEDEIDLDNFKKIS